MYFSLSFFYFFVLKSVKYDSKLSVNVQRVLSD